MLSYLSQMVCAVLGFYTPSWCWYRRPEIGTSSIDWDKLSRFLHEDGYRIRSAKCCVLKNKQDGVVRERQNDG
jgi:hypothetical protein